MKKIALLLIVFMVLGSPVYATDSDDLKKVEQEIAKHKKVSSKLEKEAKANEKELKKVQAESIKAAKAMQENEKKINKVKQELVDLSASIGIKEMELEKTKERSQAVLSSLIRVSSVPTDGFIMASDSPQELINTRILLNSAMPYLKAQAQQLQDDIYDIEEDKQKAIAKKDKVTSLNKTTKKEMANIEKLLKKKKKLKSKLTAEQKKEKAELKKLAAKASTMKELVKKLRARKVKPGVKPKKSKKKFTKTGNLPIAGRIVLRYGKKTALDLTNKGWELKGNPNGLVTCPIAGEVLYSGEFGSYDNLVVFDNGGGYNLVLAGMEKVGVDVGDNLKAGEPVGFLNSTNPKLYLEVRKNGSTINPSKVIK